MVEQHSMLEVLLQSFPQGLYEPIAVCGILGLILAMILRWKQKDAFFYMLGIGILFMICWRVGIRIVSARYTAILFFPATIGSIYLCFKLPEFLKYLPEKYLARIPEKVHKVLPWLCVTALVISCVVKAVLVNPYDDYLIRCGEYLRENAAKDEVILVYKQDQTRLEYYSGMKATGLEPEVTDYHKRERSDELITAAIGATEAKWLVLCERQPRDLPGCTLVETFRTDTGSNKKKVYVYRIEKR